MNEIAKFLTDESRLVFPNGQVIEGAEKVADAMLNACKVYNQAYNRAYVQAIGGMMVKGTLVGAVAFGVGYVVVKARNNRRFQD